MSKAAIVVLADTESHGDLGRVVNALIATKEFKDAGEDVRLIFDGAGTQWPGVLSDPSHQAHKSFEAVREAITGACGFCANAFHTEDKVRAANVTLLDEYEGHPSIKSLVDEGYQVITF